MSYFSLKDQVFFLFSQGNLFDLNIFMFHVIVMFCGFFKVSCYVRTPVMAMSMAYNTFIKLPWAHRSPFHHLLHIQ